MVNTNGEDVLILEHAKQNYHTYFNKKTGFFARVEKEIGREPFWAEAGPELLDISITNWCDRGCDICYRNSTTKGVFISLKDYEKILRQAVKIPVLQIALGGGNPNQHPNFVKILKMTRDGYGIVPSYTTNGRGLIKKILNATNKFCGAVAVSAYYPYKEMILAIKLLRDYGIKTNIHYVLHRESIDTAIDWLINPPLFLEDINALIFLNYKAMGRCPKTELLLKNSTKLTDFFKIINSAKVKFKIGFDSCCVSGIVSYMKANPVYYEACEAGRFSAYISENMNMYPCSFLAELYKGNNLGKNNIQNIWRHNPSFLEIREKLKNNECIACSVRDLCLGGCPFFKDINLCSKK